MAKKKKGPTIPELQSQIRASFKQWKKYKKSGGTDPSWPDGTNMNLIRSHVFSGQRRLRELCKEEKVRPCPIEAKLKAPPPVSDEYCAPRSKSGPCRERRAAARKRKRK
jgi:hypothetical protein